MKQKAFILLFVILLFLPLIDLLHPGLPLTHDGQDHVARIANFYQSLQEGNFVPRWAENLNWGYGHPILMFLYPLPSYIASLFRFLGFSFVASTKWVFGLSFIFSVVTMYFWLRQFLSEKAAIIGSLLYGYAPYHFVDLYVRGAIGELVAFVFPPLVLYFFFKLSYKNSYWYVLGGSLSLAAFILAHNAVSLMFLPILFGYIVYLYFMTKDKKRFLLSTVIIILFGFFLSAFFWLPAFLEGKYTLRDTVTAYEYQDRFVNLSQLFYGPWNYGQTGEFTVQVGLLQWLFILITIPVVVFFYKTKNKLWIPLVGLFIIFFAALILMTSFTKVIWDKISLLQKFQFPWRLLFVTMFTSSVIGAILFSAIPKKWQLTSFIISVIFIVLSTTQMWHPRTYLLNPEQFYTGIYNGTTDTGESSPIWSIRFMEYRPVAPIEIIHGNGQITLGQRISTKHVYNVSLTQKSQLRENTLYFPGWSILVDGNVVPIEFQDANNRGLMTFWVEQGTHTVTVRFQETKLRLLADVMSIGSLLLLFLLGILKNRLWRN